MGKTIYYGNTGLAKFGRSGNEGKTLAFYMNDDGTWEGIPFGHIRNSNAFEENNGVLSEVGINVPRFQDGKLFTEGYVDQQLGKTNDFNDVIWENTEDTTVTISSTTSPVNGSSFWELIPDATDNFHRISQSTPQTTSLDYSYSLIVKPKGNDYFIFRTNKGTGVNLNTCFNLADGTVEFDGIGGAKIRELAYGSYEISVAFEALDMATRVYLSSSPNPCTSNSITSFTGNGIDGAYICQANQKQESKLSSLVSNDTTLPNARQADTGIQSLVDLSDKINKDNFSIEIDLDIPEDTIDSRLTLSDGTTNNRVSFRFYENFGDIKLNPLVSSNGIAITNALNNFTLTQLNNTLKIDYSNTDVNIFLNGSNIFSVNHSNVMQELNIISFSAQDSVSFPLNASINYLIVKPK